MSISVAMINTDWAKASPELPRDFFLGYLRGVRDYCQAYHGGSTRKQIIDLLVRSGTETRLELLNEYVWPARDPFGRINIDSMLDMQDWFARNKFTSARLPAERLVDASYAEYAAQKLGPFVLENRRQQARRLPVTGGMRRSDHRLLPPISVPRQGHAVRAQSFSSTSCLSRAILPGGVIQSRPWGRRNIDQNSPPIRQCGGNTMMRSALLAALVGAALPVAVLAQTADDLKNDEKTPGDVLTYGMGYSQHRYSPLTQINRDNVKRLVPAWSYSMADNRGQEAQPLVKDGVIYVTDHEKTVALDALTGKQIWKSMIEYPPETTRVVCCGIVNRGAAMLDGKLYPHHPRRQVIALDIKTGKEVWRTKSSDPKDGYSMTVAPLVANGVVIVGVAGAEFGHRGYLEGLDPQTGKQLWRTYTVPAKGEPGSDTWPGNSALTGGGSTWITGSYDPELDLVFWGTGNPAPWNPLGRKGDNLHTNSILAIQPKTGKVVWYYQTSPGDPFDYDGVNELVHADLTDRRHAAQGGHAGATATASSMCWSGRPASSWRPTSSSRSTGPSASTWRPAVRCGPR